MNPADHLLITEIGTGISHEIPLERLKQGAITIGRAPTEAQKRREDFKPKRNHIYIGDNADSQGWISSYQATIFAEKNTESPHNSWDYFVHDGHLSDARWHLSQHGVWVGNQQITGKLMLRPSLAGFIQLFPKIQNDIIDSNYYCILEWPASPEPGDDTNPPTLQDLHKAEMERRIYEQEAIHAKEQLENLAKNMVAMQVNFEKEREKQNTLLFELSGAIEQQKELNVQQEEELTSRRKADKQVKLELLARRNAEKQIRIAIIGLGIVIAAIGAIALRIDSEDIREIFEWTVIILSSSAAIFGLTSGSD